MLQSTRTLRKLNLQCHNSRQFDQAKLDPSKLADGSTYPSYDSANFSALQATAVRSTHRRVIVNNAHPVIDEDNLSEGVSVINNTSAKMTCVVVFFNQRLMTYVVASLCGL